MFNTAYRIVNNRFEAEDIMQESFLSAFTKLDSFSGNVTFGAWLKRIVINNSITALKKSKRFEEISLNENIEVTSLDDDANESLKGLHTKEVLQTLNLLKPNYKLALTLHFIEGYDYEEVAQIMEISYENSRTTISRAKNKLKQLLLVRYEG